MDVHVRFKNDVGQILKKDNFLLCPLYYVKWISFFPPIYSWLPAHLAINVKEKHERERHMKKILNNWKLYLKEQEKQGRLIIFCDMDGVLTNFEKAIMKVMAAEKKRPSKENARLFKRLKKERPKLKITRDKLMPEAGFPILRQIMFNIMNDNTKFWEMLEWTKDGKELWNFLKPYNPYILTAPPDWSAVEGKKKWIKKNLGIPMNRAYFEEKKHLYATSNAVLIDDFETKVNPFREHGGMAILHTSTKNTIQELSKILKERDIKI